jgi:Mrp family chromosome partitioning ATPase
VNRDPVPSSGFIIPLEGDLPFSPGGERYGELLDEILDEAPPDRRIFITSPGNGDGKTVTAANLALVLTARKRSVLLVELALDRPKFADVFGTPPSRLGVNAVLAGRISLDRIVCRRDDNGLNLAMAGLSPTRSEPDSLILGKPFENMLEIAKASYDWTIYDGPSVEASVQVAELARAIGFTLLVVRKRSSVKLLRRALQSLDGAINLAILNNR